ncbi:MAG: DNA mismatch repair endonuclease MutL [Candidatus Riflebacteria bacterium]|nr:DNA mismatch repair endonuclease MutL [Candidatus Riflebacteria bacterium]
MAHVHVLDDATVNRIAAGEVVDRPASAVKELVENSLDACATRIQVEIARGGKARIRVVDDGEGMGRDDALLALERHATSKIRSGDQLVDIRTLGFRGEALPAIAGVSRLTLTTRARGVQEGTLIDVAGGEIRRVEPYGGPEGTTVDLVDLYFNTPARRKFLKGDGAETAAIVEAVSNAMLARPDTSFTLVANGKQSLFSSGDGSRLSVARQIFGAEVDGQLIDVEPTQLPELPYRVEGLFSRPQFVLPSRRGIRIFVNLRPIRSAALSRAILMSYKNFLPVGHGPLALLFIESPPDRVDVNVHPAKLEVRFHDSFRMEEAIADLVRARLGGRRTPRPLIDDDRPVPEPAGAAGPGAGATIAPAPGRQPLERPAAAGPAAPVRAASLLSPAPVQTPAPAGQEGGLYTAPAGWAASDGAAPSLKEPSSVPDWASLEVMGQLFGTYILGAVGETLFIVDQHVAHERVLFERALDQMSWENVPAQRLLFPISVQVPRGSEELVAERLPLLARYGFEASMFSGSTVVATTVPVLSERTDPERLLRDLIAELETLTPGFSADEALRSLAATMACRSAIMAGDVLEPSAMANLVGDLARCRHPMTCPHGRPSVLVLTARELDRRFLRC